MKGNLVDEPLDQSTLAALTAEIASAYVANNTVPLSEMANLIGSIAKHLGELGREPVVETAPKPEPAVSVRRSVQSDHVVCLLCGKRQKMLKRHLAQHHDMTPEDYRTMFELKPDYPMVAPDYTAQRSALAKKIGLGRKKEPVARKKRVARKVAKPA
jgi:predicted transcriptional regulator